MLRILHYDAKHRENDNVKHRVRPKATIRRRRLRPKAANEAPFFKKIKNWVKLKTILCFYTIVILRCFFSFYFLVVVFSF